MVSERMGAVLLVEREDPLVVSCATCGGVTQLWGYEPVELLPWKVIEHWLATHWEIPDLADDRPEREEEQ